MSEIRSLFATRLYRAHLSELGQPIDTGELEASCYSIAEDIAREALRLAAMKLPVKTRIVVREDW